MTNPDNVGGLLPCPGCGKSDLDHCPADFVAVNGLTRGMIVRCAWCHFAAPEAAWNRRELCRAAPAGGDEKVAKPLMAARETEDDGAAIMGRLARALAKADPSSKLPRMAIDWLRSQGIQWKSHCPTDPAHDFGEPSTNNKAINQLRAIRRRFDYSGTREDAERCDALDAAIDALIAPAGSGEVGALRERFSPDLEPLSDLESWVAFMRPDPKGEWVRYTAAFPADADALITDLMDAADGGTGSVYTTSELCGMAAALLRKLQQGADAPKESQ